MSAYQRHAVLRDGTSILIRSLTDADRDQLASLFSRMSAASIHHRFFCAKRELTPEDLAYLTRTSDAHVAIAATSVHDDDERVLGVGRYVVLPDRKPCTAEVAFDVGDADQGRGIGTLLLEHLAGIARDAGVKQFEADVEADNDQMLDVFARCGLASHHRDDALDHVVQVEIPLERTPGFLAASTARELQAMAHSIRPLFTPASVAIIGASRDEHAVGRAILDNVLRQRFRGSVYVIHPVAAEIGGVRCHRTLADVHAPIDLAVIAVPGPLVERVVRECAAVGVRAVVVISAGFAECSSDGRDTQLRIRDLVRAAGMRMVGPNCLGVLSTNEEVRLDATFSPVFPPAGNVSMVTQSGALGLAMIDYARERGLGLADFASVGNKADVSGNDLLSYWSQDPRTKVIGMYLESFGNARKFARVAPEVARDRPIVALKAGRSTVGARAAASHSAALATLDVGVDALFAQAGVIRTGTLERMFDVLALLSSQAVPRGGRVAVVTNAGGPGILFADACEGTGLVLPSLTETSLRALRALLPPHAGLGNPIDMIASATAPQFARTLEIVGNDPEIDAVVAMYVPPLVTRPDEIAAGIARGVATIPAEKPVAVVFMTSDPSPHQLHEGGRGRLPVYRFPENVAAALGAAVRYGQWKRRPVGTLAVLPPDREQAIRERVTAWLAAHPDGGWLEATETAALLTAAGVRMAQQRPVPANADAAALAASELGFPVVLKAIAPGLLHKTEVGGVVLGITDAEGARAAVRTMQSRCAERGIDLHGVLVQEQVERGLEMIVGIQHDTSLGPVLVAGIGGTAVELYKDVAVRLTPVSDVAAGEMLDTLRGGVLLTGFRGSAPVDRAALVELIRSVSALVEVVPELAELDLNPVIVHRDGRGATCVDARLRLTASASPRP